MAMGDRALRAGELDESIEYPAQDEEFVLYHSDSVEASGFVQHLKLPHYVDFQSELQLIRSLRRRHDRDRKEAAEGWVPCRSRAEEPTSELQSLLRFSSADFRLKKTHNDNLQSQTRRNNNANHN